MDLDALISKSVERFPDRCAFACDDQRQTYVDLYVRASRLANGLRDLGVVPGDRVATLGPNSIHTMEQIVGIALGGFVRCALYAHDTWDRHESLLRMTGASALIVDAATYQQGTSLLDAIPDMKVVVYGGDRGQQTDYEALLDGSEDHAPSLGDLGQEPHVIRFSSGATGHPKGIVHTLEGWLQVATQLVEPLNGVRPDDTFIAPGPFSHASGLRAWPFLAAGATTRVMPSFDAGRLLHLIESERVTVTSLVPTMIQKLVLHREASTRDLTSLRAVFYGTAPISEKTLTSAIDLWGDIMYQTYGQSEILPLTMLAPEHHRPHGTPDERRRLKSVGRVVSGAAVRIVDESGNELPTGEVGEIEGRSQGRMAFVWNDEAATAARVTPDGWIRTRDMGYLADDGFLYLADRKEDMINSGGFNIWPAELEDVLRDHPEVDEVSVVGVPHDKWGETPKAAVVLKPGAAVSRDELIQWTRERAGAYKRVTAVLFVESLPRNGIGKVLRRQVRAWFASEKEWISGA